MARGLFSTDGSNVPPSSPGVETRGRRTTWRLFRAVCPRSFVCHVVTSGADRGAFILPRRGSDGFAHRHFSSCDSSHLTVAQIAAKNIPALGLYPDGDVRSGFFALPPALQLAFDTSAVVNDRYRRVRRSRL